MTSVPDPSPNGRYATNNAVPTSDVTIPAASEPIDAVARPERPLLNKSLLTGADALGVALGIERGGSFLSNILAARLGGIASRVNHAPPCCDIIDSGDGKRCGRWNLTAR